MKRDRTIAVRLTLDEHTMIVELALAQGVTVSAYVRRRLLTRRALTRYSIPTDREGRSNNGPLAVDETEPRPGSSPASASP